MPVAFPVHDRGRLALLAANLCCALLAVLALWLLVRLLWALVPGDDAALAPTTAPAAGASVSAPSRSIAQWHLFGTAPAQRGGDGPSTTSLVLRGTLADADPRAGLAVIADAGNGERSWRVGEEVSPGVRLARVYADRVVVTRDGAEETLALPRDSDLRPASAPRGAPGSASSHPARVNTTTSSTSAQAARTRAPTSLQAQVERLRRNPAELMKRVQVVPVLSDGHLAGVRVSTGTDTVLLSQLGFEQGDVVTAVNGTPVDSIERGQQIMSSLGSASSVRVTVLRAGKPTEITVGLR